MTKRLKILNPTEIKYYYYAPQFSLDERQQYFALDAYEESIVKELGSLTSKVYSYYFWVILKLTNNYLSYGKLIT